MNYTLSYERRKPSLILEEIFRDEKIFLVLENLTFSACCLSQPRNGKVTREDQHMPMQSGGAACVSFKV